MKHAIDEFREALTKELKNQEFVLPYFEYPSFKNMRARRSIQARCKRRIKLIKQLLELYPLTNQNQEPNYETTKRRKNEMGASIR